MFPKVEAVREIHHAMLVFGVLKRKLANFVLAHS